MINKIKRTFVLLFVAATLLLMIGSVSAENAVELDENLEASIDSVDLSINDDGSISDLDDKVSSQATNDDETNNNLNYMNSEVVVSSKERTTIGAKDSNEDILTDNPYDFSIIKTTTTPVVVVGDDVYFDIFVQNVGPQPVSNWQINLKDFFNPDEFEYVDWHPNAWGQNYQGGYVSYDYGPHFEVNYLTYGNWPSGSTLNFTVHYRAKKPGQIQTGTQIWTPWQEYWSYTPVKVGSNNFLINKTTSTPAVKVGEDVSFDIFVQNIGPQSFTDGQLVIKDLFNPDELEYVDWSTDTSWGNLYHVIEYDGLIEIRYDTFGNWQPGYTLNFTLNFKTKKDGQLNNSAKIETYWGDYESNAYVLAGEPELTITKTPHQPLYQVGDDVYFDVFIENTGTLPVTNWWMSDDWPTNYNFMWINDWFDSSGLEFVEVIPNAYPQNYISAGLNPMDNHHIIIQYATQGMWLPGYSMNFTTHFKALKEGQFNNSVHTFWKWKWYGPAEIHRHIEVWGNNSVRVGVPEFTLVKTSNSDRVQVGDMVTFTLNYTNTGKFSLPGVYIKDNEYTNGLVYKDYSDKELWTFDGTDTWYYNSELAPGESAILELTFQATTAGEKNNTAIAGTNLTNDTVNSTDDVLVEEPETPDEPVTPDEPQEEPVEEPVSAVQKAVSLPAAGNPLFVLFCSLILLSCVSLRGKK